MRVLALAFAAGLVIACSGGGSTASSPSPTVTASPTPSPTIVVKTTTDAKLGKILVDAASGKTVYTWAADKDENSTCYDACANAWPPLTTTSKNIGGDGVTAGKFGTTARKDGTLQVTFNAHPLYFFSRDTAAGMTNGQGSTGFGAVWLVVQIQ